VVTKERFAQGMTLDEYLAQMTANRGRLAEAIRRTTLGPADTGLLARLGNPSKVLVITEDWCGTSLMHVPFVVKLVEGRPGVDLRVFLRDESPDLMDQYLKHGKYRSIPVFAFFDAEMRELARFLEQRPG
jgi:hypothetical protein